MTGGIVGGLETADSRLRNHVSS